MFFPGRGMPPMRPPGFMGGGFPAQGMGRAGGGFLSKLLSGFKGGGAANPAAMMQAGMNPANFMQGTMNPANFMGAAANTASTGGAGGSFLSNFTNPANLGSMLGNVQKVLHTAESVMPMVQQYGPLVKNIPSMIKLYKELNSSDDEEESKGDSNDKEEATKTTKKKKAGSKEQSSEETKKEDIKERNLPKSKKRKKKSKTPQNETRQSVPKLYI